MFKDNQKNYNKIQIIASIFWKILVEIYFFFIQTIFYSQGLIFSHYDSMNHWNQIIIFISVTKNSVDILIKNSMRLFIWFNKIFFS